MKYKTSKMKNLKRARFPRSVSLGDAFQSERALRASPRPTAGFVILFTVLIASIVLLMGLGIANTASKEYLLSIQSRDSAKAFFAADSGMECALYQERILGTFNSSNPLFSCDGTLVSFVGNTDTATGPVTFYVNLGSSPSVGCAKVVVTKPYSVVYGTRIESFGYNTNFVYPDCGPDKPNRIERAYRATY